MSNEGRGQGTRDERRGTRDKGRGEEGKERERSRTRHWAIGNIPHKIWSSRGIFTAGNTRPGQSATTSVGLR
jgi:hypothetical protein